jgi:diguanylate cyclase (GGDEF)-like protein
MAIPPVQGRTLAKRSKVASANQRQWRYANLRLSSPATRRGWIPTGALTRRGFAVAGETAVSQYGRDGAAAALLALDLDHFKQINDRYGHATGDEVLTAVAGACTASLRPGDVFGRIGGEEFAVLLPSTTFLAATQCAERLRLAIERLPLPCGSVTASLGIAMVQHHDAFGDWLAAADTALYDAKRLGRNRWAADERALRAA